MQASPPARRDGALEREPRELVAERDRLSVLAEHAGGKAAVELLQLVRRNRLEQPELRLPRDERDDVEQAPRRRPERGGAGQHGIADRLRQRRRSRPPGSR